MGNQLVIERLCLRTDTHDKTYEFGPGVNAVTGPIGCGKSSMLELIKYGLGGRAQVMPAVRDNVRLITIRVRAGSEHWEFTRELRSPLIQVHDLKSDEPVGQWAATNRQNMRRVGEELMNALGLPDDWRIPKSRSRPTEVSVPVTFWDVYRYLYLDQNRIDTSVIGHNDANLNNKRIAVFELIYGLASPRTTELQTQRGRLVSESRRMQGASLAIEEFLRDSGEPDLYEIGPRRAAFTAELHEAEVAITRAKDSVGPGSVSRDSIEPLELLRIRFEEVQGRVAALRSAIEEARSVKAQLDLEEKRIMRWASISGSLTGLEFVQCPRCLQQLPEERFGHSHCYLCGQHQAEEGESQPLTAQMAVLREQRKETEAILGLDSEQLAQFEQEADIVESNLLSEIRRSTESASRPDLVELESIAVASARLTGARLALESLDASEARWRSCLSLAEEAKELEKTAKDMARSESELKLELSRNSVRLDELSNLFSDILSGLNDPWFREGRIDPNDYLPVVNGESFDMLAVGGGRKTIVNFAYHLANLYMSISLRSEMTLPTLQIIDSPRKNVGSDVLDGSVVSAIYKRLRTLQDASRDGFQVIFVDNDMPADARRWVTTHIALDYDDPLVPGVRHGGEAELPLGSEGTEELS